MIISFYDKNFVGLQNNASLIVDKNNYSLTKRPVENNSFSCNCEAFTEDIQPTFMIVKDNYGKYIYGSLAGIPTINSKNITEITGTDLKSLLSSDIIIEPSTYTYVNDYINYIFSTWNTQVNQGSFTCELTYQSYVGNISMGDYFPDTEKRVVNALTELKCYLKFYNLYIDSKIDLINQKVIFTIGKTLYRTLNIKLWEYGIRNYGKYISSVNEAQGYYNNNGTWTAGYKWILTQSGNITITEANRDIYPIKRKVFVSTENITDANTQAISELLDNLYNEDIEIIPTDITPDFETKFAIYISRGANKYKDLPCGELIYNGSGLAQVKIGYLYTGAEFI